MKKRLENPSLITPSYEDKGLFKKPPTELVVQLIPKFGKNTRRDVIIKGLVQGDVEVEVVFAGRRKKQAAELVALLRRKWEVATYRLPKDVPPPDRKEIQLPTRVQGSWRTRMTEMATARRIYTCANTNCLWRAGPIIQRAARFAALVNRPLWSSLWMRPT
ncbi:hypothetical protein J7382_15335 [Shimia sp. R11_0]|uniref:hypothetical protein n=1 Tax=Shimia sp. R11_0 TaxID=2821096 RepID=UPI001ADC9F91|nr:hypothetical protein [Shimia sp. R11_0]MBO9478920.1 hypothetical protein [Shimia sp. R11_0]